MKRFDRLVGEQIVAEKREKTRWSRISRHVRALVTGDGPEREAFEKLSGKPASFFEDSSFAFFGTVFVRDYPQTHLVPIPAGIVRDAICGKLSCDLFSPEIIARSGTILPGIETPVETCVEKILGKWEKARNYPSYWELGTSYIPMDTVKTEEGRAFLTRIALSLERARLVLRDEWEPDPDKEYSIALFFARNGEENTRLLPKVRDIMHGEVSGDEALKILAASGRSAISWLSQMHGTTFADVLCGEDSDFAVSICEEIAEAPDDSVLCVLVRLTLSKVDVLCRDWTVTLPAGMPFGLACPETGEGSLFGIRTKHPLALAFPDCGVFTAIVSETDIIPLNAKVKLPAPVAPESHYPANEHIRPCCLIPESNCKSILARFSDAGAYQGPACF